MEVPREEVLEPLVKFLTREHQAQGERSLRLTSNISNVIMQLARGDVGRGIGLEKWLASQTTVADIAEFAAEVVRRLPPQVHQGAVDRLARGSGDTPPGRAGRLKDLVEGTKEQEESEHVLRTRDAEGLPPWRSRRPDLLPDEAPPLIPVSRIIRIIAGLPGAWKPPARPKKAGRAEPRTYPEVERVIREIPEDDLVPIDARATPNAGNYADAREFARQLALDLDVAQQEGKESIRIDLGGTYRGIRLSEGIHANLRKIDRIVRRALPHHASAVRRVEIYFGEKQLGTVLVGQAND